MCQLVTYLFWFLQKFNNGCNMSVWFSVSILCTAVIGIPRRNSSGCSDISQCPASMSTSRKRGKNLPMIGNTSSGTYLLFVPLMNSAGFSKRTSSGFLYGKSPMWLRDLASISNGIRKLCVALPSGRYRFPSKNWRIGSDYMLSD